MRIPPPWSILMLALLCSCSDEVVVGNGRLVETRRNVESFSRIAVDNSFRVQVELGEQSVTLLLDDNLEPHVRTRVVMGELWVHPEPHFDLAPSAGTLLDIVTPNISALAVADETHLTGKTNASDVVLEASDEATLDVEALGARTVSIEASGESRIRQTGSGRRLVIQAADEASVESEVFAEEVDIEVSGGSRVTVHASSSVRIDASGNSTVTIIGNPSSRDVELADDATATYAD